MKIEKKVVSVPTEVTVGEQVEEICRNAGQDAVLLAKNGDRGMYVWHRGQGGAWWRNDPNDRHLETTALLHDLRNKSITEAILITRSTLNDLLSGALDMISSEEA